MAPEQHDTEIEIRRVRDQQYPPDYRKLRREIGAESIHRVGPGAYALTAAWRGLSSRERHRMRVVEATLRMRRPALVSHFAAASVHRIEILGRWPSRIDVRVDGGSGGRSSGLIRRHGIGVDADAEQWGVHRITTPAQTAIDIAAIADHTQAVVVLDQVLWARRPGGPLATIEELRMLAARRSSSRGRAKIRHALDEATALSDSVRESQSRVLLKRLGFPEPVLQREFTLLDGSTAQTDFYFPEYDHVGEFDGVGKYLDPALLRGRTPADALIEEKDRGDALARIVSRVSRWRTPHLRRPRELYDILVADGLPSRLPPPPRSLQLPR
ncbi:hypothetical protein ACFPJ2_00275 [Microbacterium suwonense]|uniref:hypothetical protein n=1 Tax=Microbacterium suwonense TaxID=683047 RepID=UPI0036184A98